MAYHTSAPTDTRLTDAAYGLLSYILHRKEMFATDETPTKTIAKRFGKERTWWHRNFAALKKLGYAKYQKKNTKNGMTHNYYFSDDYLHLQLADLDAHVALEQHGVAHVANMQQAHVANMQHGETEYLSSPHEVEGPFAPKAHVAPEQPIVVKRSYKERYNARARKKPTKFVDAAIATNDEYQLRVYYENQNVYEMPSDRLHWIEAGKAGIQLWAKVTREDFDWSSAEYINRELGTEPNEKAFASAYQGWTNSGFKKSNIIGIISWYKLLLADPTATPWDYSRGEKGKNGHNRSGKSARKEHGLSTVPFDESKLSHLDLSHLDLPPLPTDDDI